MKYIIAILWFGLMSANVLNAQTSRIENKKQETILPAKDTLENTLNNIQISIPFGQTDSRSVVGDISTINPDKEIGYDNSSSVNEALSGRIPGIYSGTNLRGLGNALIVIDGIPGSLSSLNLSEVEQITVLKDVNSAIMYGVQANNGVILITTKRGKANQNKITTIAETGFALPISFPKYLGSSEYMSLYNEALSNDDLTPRYTQAEIDATKSGTNPTRYPDANYFSSTFLKSYKPYSRIITDFSGGNKNAQYYANLGWQHAGSLNKLDQNIHTDRLNLRSNLNLRINDVISGRVDIVTIFNIANVPNSDFFSDATSLKPNYYPPLIDVALVGDKKLVNAARLIQGKYLLGGTSQYRNNVYGNALLSGYSKQINTTGLFNLGLDFDLKSIAEGLTFKTYGSFNFYNQFNENQTNTYAIYEPKWLVGQNLQDSLTLTKIGVDSNSGTQGISNTSLSRDYSFYGILDYTRKIGKSDFSATMMGFFDKYNVAGVFQTDKHSHLGSRINYVYDKKYIVNLSGALVSSPKLSPDNRLGFSPSVALGWVISEDLFRGNPVINFLKLSASGGIINTDMSLTKYYSYEDIWSPSAIFRWSETTRQQAATILSNVANDKLFFEKRKEFNIGLEGLLFNNSLQIDGNVFLERRSDQIVVAGLANTYPAYLGSLNPSENFDEDEFRGIELGISWRKSLNDFSFDLGTSMLFLDSKVLKQDEYYEWDYLYRRGRSTGAIFGLEDMGLFKDEADIASHATQLFGPVKPGDIKYKDQNGDKVVDSNDLVVIGNSNAKIIGGLSLKLNYKNFTLFTLGTTRYGGDRFFNNSYYWVNGDIKYSEVVRNRWTPATASTATYPRLSSKSNANNFRTSTYWIEDNSLISLERVQLSYDLPEHLAKKIFTKNFSLYFRGSNLMNFAGNKDKMELSIGSEPQYRNYSVGLKALF